LALATEQFGNTPVKAGFSSFTPDLLPVLNDATRVYWYEVNGDACFYYQGDTADLNALLARFAAGGKGREVVLHAEPLMKTSLQGTHAVEARWYVHVPGGISLSDYADGGLVTDKGPALHLYLPRVRPGAPAPPAQVSAWIAALEGDDAKAREAAARDLGRQGAAAEAALRKALEDTSSSEARTRLRAILKGAKDINLDAVAFPDGVTLVGPDELAARYAKGLKSQEPVIRGVAAGHLAVLEPDRQKAVAGLLDVLREDKHEYVRRSVAGALQREGGAARSALPVLRGFVDDPDVNIKNAFRAAVEKIEASTEDRAAKEKAEQMQEVRRDIAAYLKSRAAKTP
ncbi:MAG TPA: HEAT repeat domain-containing protein, partial [Urbifossiella sp.]|nr:HEAT repeat domain-containing protein [Urbifossiella sp.]